MVISGKELSAKLKAEMAAEVAAFGAKYGRVPHLVVILVGEDPGSVSYVTGKAKASAEVGIRNTTIRKPESVCEAELLGIIADLNADEAARIRTMIEEGGHHLLGELPFSPLVTQAMVRRKTLTEEKSALADLLAAAWERVCALAAQPVRRGVTNNL